ncbi:MAG: hypothetical protein H6Q89_1221 [Myxococcaceae bacterium]|nr:hypothetical protein [Myxococcaceae bacterium]
MRIWLRWCLPWVLFCLLAEARPYRGMITRTAETTRKNHVEVGLRYQGFWFGAGRLGVPRASTWHQAAAHVRWGIIEGLELETQVEALIDFDPRSPPARAYFGDIPIGLQWTFFSRPKFALGVFARVTIPTGPGNLDMLPPTLSDGTLDVEGTFLAEIRPTTSFRVMFNVGFVYMGTRTRAPAAAFEVPEAIKYGVAGTLNLGKRFLFALEVVGHSFFRPDITPLWTDNQHLVEVVPGARFEILPRLVLEAALGIAVTPQLRQIHQFRPLLGLTYEFGA